jgi:hypothetical protein
MPPEATKGDLQLLRCARQEDEIRHIVSARMAAAFEAVDTDGIATDQFGLQRMARQRRISLASASGVRCVSPVMMPSPLADDTAATSSAKPT